MKKHTNNHGFILNELFIAISVMLLFGLTMTAIIRFLTITRFNSAIQLNIKKYHEKIQKVPSVHLEDRGEE